VIPWIHDTDIFHASRHVGPHGHICLTPNQTVSTFTPYCCVT